MKNLRILLATILFVTVGFFVTTNVLPYGTKSIVRSYPDLKNEKNITLKCTYQGQKLEITETVYGSLAEYYKTDPKKYLTYYKNDNKGFVFEYEKDQAVDGIVAKIDKIADSKKLSDDQEVDLAACFLQSIPYDEAKAQKILSDKNYPLTEVIPRYPYETLYDFKGICTDKSFLGSLVLTKLGYENSLLSFDKQRHLSIGIAVPAGYGQLGTNFAVLETTGNGFFVGDLPEIKNKVGLAENTIDSLPELGKNQRVQSDDLSALSDATRIEVVSGGKVYTRIADRVAMKKQIESLSQDLKASLILVRDAQEELSQAQNQVKNAENIYKLERTRESYNTYLSVYSSYQTVLAQTNAKIYKYNQKVKEYNSLVEDYKAYL